MCWLASPSIPSKNWTSSCPGIGASSTSETVRRLDRYILRAIPPRSSPDANIQVRVPSLHATFLGQQVSGTWRFAPIESEQGLGLKAGAIEPAHKVLLRMQPAARKLDLNTPG